MILCFSGRLLLLLRVFFFYLALRSVHARFVRGQIYEERLGSFVLGIMLVFPGDRWSGARREFPELVSLLNGRAVTHTLLT